ncbi:MAG: RNA-binding S4 domain-containing protein [Erysipelotrichaceae bacterium]|nr:RNA-binding S4 domain-containing protein [Erysipelotrichaceae bacterium]
MRIDKFLKVSRILKRRTVSKELALNDRIEINGKVVKPSHKVKVDDIVSITFGNRKVVVKVLDIGDVKRKEEAKDSYEIISDEFIKD